MVAGEVKGSDSPRWRSRSSVGGFSRAQARWCMLRAPYVLQTLAQQGHGYRPVASRVGGGNETLGRFRHPWPFEDDGGVRETAGAVARVCFAAEATTTATWGSLSVGLGPARRAEEGGGSSFQARTRSSRKCTWRFQSVGSNVSRMAGPSGDGKERSGPWCQADACDATGLTAAHGTEGPVARAEPRSGHCEGRGLHGRRAAVAAVVDGSRRTGRVPWSWRSSARRRSKESAMMKTARLRWLLWRTRQMGRGRKS